MLGDAKILLEKCTALNLTREQVCIAFAHSKILHVKEMDDIGKYEQLSMVEFHEFIARLAVLKFDD